MRLFREREISKLITFSFGDLLDFGDFDDFGDFEDFGDLVFPSNGGGAGISKLDTMGNWFRIMVTNRSRDSGRFLKLEYRDFLEIRFSDLPSSHRKRTPSRVTTIMCRESQVIDAIRSVSNDSANNGVCCLCFAGIRCDRLPHDHRKHLLVDEEEGSL